ncbi:DUF4870 domain-containing protein [Odoribacter laneus]|uniref:DUF4870 domain-containing protein n=1 Tax=Odoribacter laneus TaxID=626933 RepID=UPI003AB80859
MENRISDSEKQYAMFIHISQFAGVIIPGLGWILPLVLWLTKKDTSSYIDANGKIVMNWIISSFLYAIGATILTFILIGIPLLIALGICSLIFTIIGAIRANDGILWPYPLSIKFIN